MARRDERAQAPRATRRRRPQRRPRPRRRPRPAARHRRRPDRCPARRTARSSRPRTSGTCRIDGRPVAAGLGDADHDDRPGSRPAHGLRVVRRLRHPVPGRDRLDHAAIDRRLRLRRRVRPRRLPDPGQPARSRAAPIDHILHGRQGRLPALRAVRRSPEGGGVAGRERRDLGPALQRPRPAGWTSADAAGLPILPGLVRYDEVAAGADRRTPSGSPTNSTRRAYIYPARHYASTSDLDSRCRRWALRVRLKATFDTGGLSPTATGHRRSAEALRDDPRRQRLALVHHRASAIRGSTTTCCTSWTSSPAATSRSSIPAGWSTARNAGSADPRMPDRASCPS